MTKTKGLLLAAMVAAMAFTFSCSDDKDESDDTSGGGVCVGKSGSFNAMCLKGQGITEESCNSITAGAQLTGSFSASGNCPSNEVLKCENFNAPGLTLYMYVNMGTCADLDSMF